MLAAGCVEVRVVGRTIPSWRMVVEDELPKLQKFGDFLRSEDKKVLDDLLLQCRLYASYAGTMASPIRALPLLMSMMFGQHKRLMELEKKIDRQTELLNKLTPEVQISSVESSVAEESGHITILGQQQLSV
jgi:hypothetical protein